MARIVLKGARYPGDIAFEDGLITEIGVIASKPDDLVVDVGGDIVTPG